MKSKAGYIILLALLAVSLAAPRWVSAQEDRLELGLSRDFGYGAGAQVQGNFSYRVRAPESVVRVEFLLDGEVIGEDTEAPFAFRFQTGDYENGWHTLSAIGYTANGQRLASNTLRRQFVPLQNALYLVGGILLLVAAFMVVRYFVAQRSEYKPKQGYGLMGGAVCPNCGRPFGLHLWGVNLMAGRLDRCPHCGKWNFVQRATPQMLASAERFASELDAEATDAVAVTSNEEARLRRQIDESRFED